MLQFYHHDLQLLNPSFDSPLVNVLAELEFLRRLRLEGDAPPQVFFQLKALFHSLESNSAVRDFTASNPYNPITCPWPVCES